MYLLGARRGYSGAELKALLDRSLKPVGMILLVIACGGVIRWMLQDCGLGQVIGPMLEASPLPLVVVAFLIAVMVRASVGSSIVAMTMASGIMAAMPAVAGASVLMRASICLAICGGATALSHVNDAGFGCAPRSRRLTRKPPSSLDHYGDAHRPFGSCLRHW